jgi:hypothetical protein
MALLRPNHVVAYDPSGVLTANQQARVYYDPTIKPDTGGRRRVYVLQGGGFLPGSGTLPDGWDPDLGGELGLCYKAGDAVVMVGYTPHSPTILGQGAFDYQQWNLGPGEVLTLDSSNPAKMARRCAERDVVNCLQHFATFQVGDLSRSPRRAALWAKSAGFLASSFAVFGPQRGDSTATIERFRAPTRVAAFMGRASISSPPAWLHTRFLRHWSNGFGVAAQTIGGAVNASNPANLFSGLINMRQSSALWMIEANSPQMAQARRDNASMPVWIENTGSVAFQGPYTYSGMWNVLTEDHPPEAVMSIQTVLQALQAEFPAEYVHDAKSAFVLTGPGETAPTDEDRWAWLDQSMEQAPYVKVL